MKYRLGDICRIEKGKTGITKAIPGQYPLVTTAAERKEHDEFQFDEKAVIIPLVSGTGHGHASINRIHYQEGKFALGSILCAVVSKDENLLNPKYLHVYLQRYKDVVLVPLMKGAANVSLPINKLSSLIIDIPSLSEQLEVVKQEEKLSAELEKMEFLLAQQEADVSKLRQAFLQEAVQGKLVPQDSEEEPAAILLQKLKESKAVLIKNKKTKWECPVHIKSKEVPPYDIPESWEWVRLWDVAWCFRGHNPPKSEFSDVPKEGFVRFVQITDFKTNKKAVYVPKSKKLKLVTRGEILMAAYRHIGKLSRDMEGAFNVALCKVNNIEPFNRDFLEVLIKSDLITKELLAASERGHIPSMHTDHLLSLWVVVPPLSEQSRILSKLQSLMQLCDELEQSIRQSRQQAYKLLQQALNEKLIAPVSDMQTV